MVYKYLMYTNQGLLFRMISNPDKNYRLFPNWRAGTFRKTSK